MPFRNGKHANEGYFSFEEREGVAVITLNREGDPYNTLNPAFNRSLGKAYEYCDEANEIKALIMTGTGRVFSTGADVKNEFPRLDSKGAKALAEEGSETVSLLERIGALVIGAINGICLGGGLELALSCDYRIASNKAMIGQTEINLALIPGWGGTQRLPRLIGRSRATRLICTGEHVRADQALGLGIVDEVVPHEQLMARALELAAQMRNKSKPAIRLAKKAINEGLQVPLSEGLKLEAGLFSAAWELEDRQEGVKAFLEKRKPEFKNR